MKKGFKKVLAVLLSATMLFSTYMIVPTQAADKVVATKYGGWFEYGFAFWDKVQGAEGYNVYYKLKSDTAFTQLTGDDAKYLIRESKDGGMQVDIPGLLGGKEYDIKINPVMGGSENEAKGTTVTVTTLVTDRSGYGFANDTVWTTGGYNKDGTVPDNAIVTYIVEGKTGADVDSALGQNEKVPRIVRIIGTVNTNKITFRPNVTLEGIGDDATIIGNMEIGSAAKNVEIRNLNLAEGYDGDGIVICRGYRAFLHNLELHEGGENGDGTCDMTTQTDYVTFSYNKLIETKKSMLLGARDDHESKDKGHLLITLHHNWYKDNSERNARIRTSTAHVYNNYYDGVKLYCIGAACHAQVYAEGNYFYNSQRPMICSGVGNSIMPLDANGNVDPTWWAYFKQYNTNASKNEMRENGYNLLTTSPVGYIKSVNNYVDPTCKYYEPEKDIVAENFTFDPNKEYTYKADTPEKAKELVEKYAGVLVYDVNDQSKGGTVVEPTTQTTTQNIETTTESTTTSPTALVGDVNKDGEVTASDAANVLAFVLNSDSFSLSKDIADVDTNGEITASDASAILAKVLNSDFIF